MPTKKFKNIYKNYINTKTKKALAKQIDKELKRAVLKNKPRKDGK